MWVCVILREMKEVEEQRFDEVTGFLRKTRACTVVQCQ